MKVAPFATDIRTLLMKKIQKVRITHFQEILAKESQEGITDADGPNTSFGMLGESN